MKKLFVIVCAATIMVASTSCKGGVTSDLKSQEDSLAYYFGEMWGNGVGSEMKNDPEGKSMDKAEILKGIETVLACDTTQKAYIMGLQIGMQLNNITQQLSKQDSIDIDKAKHYAAFKAAFTKDSIGSPQEAQEKVMTLIDQIKNARLEKSPEAIANKNAGEQFIANEMKKDPSLKKTQSGLVYKVIEEGAGTTIKASDRVKVKYVGKHIDGTEFDNSGDETRTFSPAGVIPGFSEGLLMMKPGAHYILSIPAEIGYGLKGHPMGGIKPNETLIFDVTLVGVEEEAQAK